MTTLSPPATPGLALFEELVALREAVREEAERTIAAWLPFVRRRSYAPSAGNLAAYLALRRRDLRALQLALMPLGLSSLGRCESRALANLDAVIAALGAQLHHEAGPMPTARAFYRGARLLVAHTAQVFGPKPGARDVRIMITLDERAANDTAFVRGLLAAGMDCARINAAHDDPATWEAMIRNVRDASRALARPCTIHFDLPGPKVRTAKVRMLAKRVHVGDTLVLGEHARNDRAATDVDASATFACTIPQVRRNVRVGQPLWIDDGKIGTRAIARDHGALMLRVTSAPADGAKIKPGKGVNVPETDLELPSLMPSDRATLATFAPMVDIIGYSFVRTPADVDALCDALDAHGAMQTAISLKIETAEAVRNLPGLIVHAAGRRPTAVMVARGDLAVEIGYRRLAEIQEEILWICEAAHVPVIWATQVLDTLVREGVGTRAEFTDAAMAERADCVMLNKGAYVVKGVEALVDVLERMEGHQMKKMSRLRALHTW